MDTITLNLQVPVSKLSLNEKINIRTDLKRDYENKINRWNKEKRNMGHQLDISPVFNLVYTKIVAINRVVKFSKDIEKVADIIESGDIATYYDRWFDLFSGTTKWDLVEEDPEPIYLSERYSTVAILTPSNIWCMAPLYTHALEFINIRNNYNMRNNYN